MKKEYKVERDTLSELLNDVEEFEDKFGLFTEKYPSYSYTLNISKGKEKWFAEVKIEKDENITTT